MALNIKDLALIGGGLYILGKVAGNYAYERFSLKGARVKFGNLNWEGVSGQIFLEIENQTAVPVTIQSIAGQVKYTGISVANYNITAPFTIQPNGSTVQAVSFFIPYEGVATTVSNAIATGEFSTYALIEGVARVAGVNIPFSYPLSPI